MDRKETVKILNQQPAKLWDFLVIGGGATGLGTALDSTLRGFSTLLLEQSDFTKGTSSRSTKLVHGGVRYLAQGDIGLVLEALKERGILLKNAPHVTSNQSFIIPTYSFWKTVFYAAGLKLYDLLAGKLSLGKSIVISKKNVIKFLANVNPKNLSNGILYHDGQFDDARLGINLAESCSENGGFLANYFQVKSFLKVQSGIWDVMATDLETGKVYSIRAKALINATGVFVDNILLMDKKESEPIVKASQGTHIVIDKLFLPGSSALMIPKTSDGRVLFAIPWHGKVLVGTTDTGIEKADLEPLPQEAEVNFILDNLKSYLIKVPEKKDILSVFTGLRPLARPDKSNKASKEISRRHKLIVSGSGLVTITGGKWTTYRQMAEETVDKAIEVNKLVYEPCKTVNFKIHGHSTKELNPALSIYGSDAEKISLLINSNPEFAEKLHEDYPFTKGEVIWFVRNEMARTVEDVLARRFRILFFDAHAALKMAGKVAEILQKELKNDQDWVNGQVVEFNNLVKGYLIK